MKPSQIQEIRLICDYERLHSPKHPIVQIGTFSKTEFGWRWQVHDLMGIDVDTFECRRCHQSTVWAKQRRTTAMQEVLDSFAEHSGSEVLPLRTFAAMIGARAPGSNRD